MQVVIFVSHFNPCNVSTTPSSPKIASQLHLKPIQQHSVCVSSFRSCINCIQVTSLLYKLHPCTFRPSMSLDCHLTFIQLTFHHHPGADIRVSPPSKSRHTSNRTSTDHLHAGHISPPSKWRYKYHLHPHPIPPQPRPIGSHLNSVQVACHLNLCPDNCISPPSKCRINSFLSLQIASELHSNTITKSIQV